MNRWERSRRSRRKINRKECTDCVTPSTYAFQGPVTWKLVRPSDVSVIANRNKAKQNRVKTREKVGRELMLLPRAKFSVRGGRRRQNDLDTNFTRTYAKWIKKRRDAAFCQRCFVFFGVIPQAGGIKRSHPYDRVIVGLDCLRPWPALLVLF